MFQLIHDILNIFVDSNPISINKYLSIFLDFKRSFWSLLCKSAWLLKKYASDNVVFTREKSDLENLESLLKRIQRVTTWCGDSVVDAASPKIADYRLGLYRAGRFLVGIFDGDDDGGVSVDGGLDGDESKKL